MKRRVDSGSSIQDYTVISIQPPSFVGTSDTRRGVVHIPLLISFRDNDGSRSYSSLVSLRQGSLTNDGEEPWGRGKQGH